MTENNEEVTFSQEYVKELRDEAASTRRKLRELETQVRGKDISLEFAKRGITADPSWINIPEGISIPEAVDQFLSTFKVEPATSAPQDKLPPKSYPAALQPERTHANASGPSAQGALGGRTLDELKADPVARKAIQDKYRELIHGSSYGSEESIFTK